MGKLKMKATNVGVREIPLRGEKREWVVLLRYGEDETECKFHTNVNVTELGVGDIIRQVERDKGLLEMTHHDFMDKYGYDYGVDDEEEVRGLYEEVRGRVEQFFNLVGNDYDYILKRQGG